MSHTTPEELKMIVSTIVALFIIVAIFATAANERDRNNE